MIQFPVLVNAGADADIAKTRFVFTVEGQEPVIVDHDGNGFSDNFTVPDGSNGECYSQYIDKAGNISEPSAKATWTNAADTTPPAAPGDAPTIGRGQTV